VAWVRGELVGGGEKVGEALAPVQARLQGSEKMKEKEIMKNTNRAGSGGAFLGGLDCRGVVDMEEIEWKG
jgi:hypothetical protein